MTSESQRRWRRLGDDLQDVEDQLHDDRALAQLTRPAVDDGDQSAVQVAQVLRQEGLAVTSCQVTHLEPQTLELDYQGTFQFSGFVLLKLKVCFGRLLELQIQ